MNYLKTFAVDSLKVESSSIRDFPDETNNKAFVRAIVALGRHLQTEVIAEGAEPPDPESYLRENACDEIQGDFSHPPLSEPECREISLRPR